MPYIDWSDPEEMFGLLVEFVADERSEAHDDPKRRRFLAKLLSDLTALQEQFGTLSPSEGIESLRSIHNSVEEEFENDAVVEHLGACVEELERINGESAA